jgi:ADP-heptose:LPS heptosyltransferase
LLLTGRTTLLQLGAVLEQCDILVTGDTGPMHAATAVGTRVVALFGAADPDRTGPLGRGHRIIQAPGVACVPCRSRTCRNPVPLECMKKIAPETVYETIVEMLRKGPV